MRFISTDYPIKKVGTILFCPFPFLAYKRKRFVALSRGAAALMGETISVRCNFGVESNDLTLGNGFYTSTSKEIVLSTATYDARKIVWPGV